MIDILRFSNPNRHPDYQTEEICLEAIRENSYSFLNVKEQTVNICLLAMSRNGILLYVVEDQTPEICLQALKTTWSNTVYNLIKIPIEGDFLREINRLKLLNGPL